MRDRGLERTPTADPKQATPIRSRGFVEKVRMLFDVDRNESTTRHNFYPKPGDLVTFQRPGYYHWAVYVGDGLVVHLAGDREENLKRLHLLTAAKDSVKKGTPYFGVHKARLDDVCEQSCMGSGNFTHIVSLGPPYPPQMIVERALLMVGQPGYQLIKNNCEHFATWARYGKGYSEQTKQPFKSLPAGCRSAEKRQQIDEQTQCHLATKRLTWVGVLVASVALKRFHFLKEFGAVSDVQWEIFESEADERVRQLLSDPEDHHLHPGVISGGVGRWLVSCRHAERPLSNSFCRSWQVYPIDCGNPKETIEYFQKYFVNVDSSSRRAVRHLAARAGKLLVVTGPRVGGEQVDVCVASSAQQLHDFVFSCWERKLPSYIYLCIFFCGHWLAVASNKLDFEDQKILQAQFFPSRRVKHYICNGWLVNCIAGGSEWVVFLDKTSQSCRQVVFKQTRPDEEFPVDKLQALMEEEQLVLAVATGN